MKKKKKMECYKIEKRRIKLLLSYAIKYEDAVKASIVKCKEAPKEVIDTLTVGCIAFFNGELYANSKEELQQV